MSRSVQESLARPACLHSKGGFSLPQKPQKDTHFVSRAELTKTKWVSFSKECAFSKTANKINHIDELQQPCIAATPEAIGKPGLGKLDVVCPGIVGDCLENLGEIALEGKTLFLNKATGLINLEHRLVLNRPARKTKWVSFCSVRPAGRTNKKASAGRAAL